MFTQSSNEPRANHSGVEMENTPLPEYTIGANYVHGVDVKSFIDMLQHHSTINELDTYQAAIISNHSNLVVPETLPTDKLACVDELYYLDAGDTSSEINYDPHDGGGIAWNEIGRHMYFHPVLRKLTHSILRKTFGLPEDAKIPSVSRIDRVFRRRRCESMSFETDPLTSVSSRFDSMSPCISGEPVSQTVNDRIPTPFPLLTRLYLPSWLSPPRLNLQISSTRPRSRSSITRSTWQRSFVKRKTLWASGRKGFWL
jgi:hypothetical protein